MGRIVSGLWGGGFGLAGIALAAGAWSCGGSDNPQGSNSGTSGTGGAMADGALDAPLGGSAGMNGASGTAGDSAVAGVREACIAWCEKLSEANCPGHTPRDQCPQACDLLNPEFTCASEYAATAECVREKARFVCLSETSVQMHGCWAEIRPYALCAACLPSTGDDACDTCTKTECCDERKAYLAHPDFGPYTDCLGNCGPQDAGSSCAQACIASFPDLQTHLKAFTDCFGTCLTTCR